MESTEAPMNYPVMVEISAHHVHLSQQDVEALFGKGHELTVLSELSQPGQFACHERVNLIGPKGTIKNVRVLGPARSATQVEISLTEQFKLGIRIPVRESGKTEGSPGVVLEGPAGSVTLKEGVIAAARHIHMTPEDAERMNLHDKDVVSVRIDNTERGLVFNEVLVRVSPKYSLAMHIDTDEANAAGLSGTATGYIERIQRPASA